MRRAWALSPTRWITKSEVRFPAPRTAIEGATSKSYTIEAARLGDRMEVEVSFTDGAGNAEKIRSDETPVVLAAGTANQRPLGRPSFLNLAGWPENPGGVRDDDNDLRVGDYLVTVFGEVGDLEDPDGDGDLRASEKRPSQLYVAGRRCRGSGRLHGLQLDACGCGQAHQAALYLHRQRRRRRDCHERCVWTGPLAGAGHRAAHDHRSLPGGRYADRGDFDVERSRRHRRHELELPVVGGRCGDLECDGRYVHAHGERREQAHQGAGKF